MNKKDGNNKREGARPTSARSNSKKPTPGGMPKRAQSPKKETRGKAEHSGAEAPKRAPRPAKSIQNNVSKPLKSDDIRLNKYISNSGVCSRRDADIYIQSGNVKVNNVVITEMGYKVKP
ncbi:S4 domain-containing protein, partial [Flavobacterium sp.]|uniref:S4 domain-containing protein n=1 Tax=Flavobacterium sp. TaxID=239 RepID=UPI00391948E1